MYAHLRQTSPVLYQPEHDLWVLYRYAEVRAVLNDPVNFSNDYAQAIPPERMVTDSIATMDPPRHTQVRGLISRAFTSKAISEMDGFITRIAHDLLDAVIAKGQMDLVADFAVPLPTLVIAEMLGVPSTMLGPFKLWSNHIIESGESLVTGDMSPKPHIEASFREARSYFAQLAVERRSAPGPDLISRLASAEVDGQRLNDAEVVETCLLLMMAGNETTTNLLGNAVRTLLEYPEQFALLRRDRSLLPYAIEEMLRFRSPAQMVTRVARHDIVIGGQQIKAGQRVMNMLGSANRDEAVFTDPEGFDITRDPNPHVAFGHGAHFCIGAMLARLETRIALSALLERLEGLELAGDLEPLPTMTIMGLRKLPLRFRPANR